MVPKQRGSGQFGGDGHRSNRSAFRRSGGNVKPPSKGCAVIVLAGIGGLIAAVTLVAHIPYLLG